MACNHHNRDLWIGKADGIFCQICGAKIDTKASAPAPEPVKDPEPEKKAPAKKAPAKKTTTRGGKK